MGKTIDLRQVPDKRSHIWGYEPYLPSPRTNPGSTFSLSIDIISITRKKEKRTETPGQKQHGPPTYYMGIRNKIIKHIISI